MANQITVNSGTGNITVTTSRSVIGTVANVATANFANYAGEVTNAAQPNITSVGTLGNLTVSGEITTQDLTVTGNLAVGNLIANTANYANFAGTANTVSDNAQPNITSVGTLGNLDVSGTITANLIQANTIEGNIALTKVDYIDFDTANGAPSFQTGRVYWDSAKISLAVDMNGGGNITQQVGEDQYIYVKANADITFGQVAMFNGVQGDTILAAPANTASAGFLPRYTIGVAPANIANGSFGYIQTFGEIYNLQTNAFPAGSILYLQANSAGAMTVTEPTAPDPKIVVAACLTQSNTPSATNGRIQVRPDFGYTVEQLHNVSNVSATTGDVLVYNASNVWSPSNTVPLANLATFATTANAVAGANVSGEVAFANTANNVAGGNVSGSVANAVYADTAGSAGSAPPAGSNTQVQFNDEDVLAGDANLTYNKTAPALAVGFSGNGQLLSSQLALNKNLTANSYLISTVANLNNSGDMTLWKANITDTVSGANTKLIDFIVDGNSQLTLDKGGNHTVAGQSEANSFYTTGTDGNVTIATNTSFDGGQYGAVWRVDSNTSAGTLSQAFVADNYDVGGFGYVSFDTFANTSNSHVASGASMNFYNYDPIGNSTTDPLVAGQVVLVGNPRNANLANASTGTRTTLTMSGPGADGFLTVVGAGASANGFLTGAWKQFQYRDNAMDFIQRNGNGEARAVSLANDEISLNFYPTQLWNGSPQPLQYPAKMGGKVDPTWVDPGTGAYGVQSGLFFETVDINSSNISHRMFSNGVVQFNSYKENYLGTPQATNPVTIGANGSVTATGFVDATGNVSGGNITTVGVVSATGNVSGGNIVTGGVVDATGNVSGANIVATTFTVLGNETVANLTTNTPVVTGVAGAMIAVSDQDYQPAHWSVTDNVWKYVSNRANV